MALMERNCVKCGKEYLGQYPRYCCSGSGCGCQGVEIDPPLCEQCESDFYGTSEDSEANQCTN